MDWCESKVLQYELDRTLFDNKIKLSNAQYATAMEGIRKLQQDNDINAFRNRMERLFGDSSDAKNVASELFKRMMMYMFRDSRELDQMFNPK